MMLYLLDGNMEYVIHGLNVKEGRYSTKGNYTKSTFLVTMLCDHGCYIHQYGRDLMDLLLDLSSLTPNCGHEDKKQMEKCLSAMHICFII